MRRKFACFKLFQAVVTFVLLWQNLALHQFCGHFVAPKTFVKSAALAGRCERFTVIGGMGSTSERAAASADLQKWIRLIRGDQALIDQEDFMDGMASEFPTGHYCFPITFSLVSAYKNALLRITTNHVESIIDLFARQLIYALLFLCVLTLHTLRRQRRFSSRYDRFDYECAFYGFFIWCATVMVSSFLLLKWTAHWQCTNFRADISYVPVITLILGTVLMCSCLCEILFNHSLLTKRRRLTVAVITQSKSSQTKLCSECGALI